MSAPEPTGSGALHPYSFARTLLETAAALDDLGFALARVEPEREPEVDAELVRAGRALATAMTGFGLRIGDYDLTPARASGEERKRRDSLHEAAHAVVEIALDLDVSNVTLHPDYPAGEVEFGPQGSEVLDREATMTPERRAELRPRAEAMISTLLAGGYAEALVYGVVPVGAGFDLSHAAGVGQFFGIDPADDRLHQRAVALVQAHLRAIEKVAAALRELHHVPVLAVVLLLQESIPASTGE